MTRLIDADGLCEEFKKRHRAALRWKEQAILDNDEERIIRSDATLAFLSEVKLTIDNAPTVIPEEMKPLIEKTIEILPQLTDAIVENLPRILDDIDICQECEYRKASFKEADNDSKGT